MNPTRSTPRKQPSSILLQRLIDDGQATQGVLVVNGAVRPFPTVERPWLQNKANVSCIPPGSYGYAVTQSPRFKQDLIRLNDDELPGGRFAILLHPANQASELQGCIAPGMDFAHFDGGRGVSNSRHALALIMGLVPKQGRIIIEPAKVFTAGGTG